MSEAAPASAEDAALRARLLEYIAALESLKDLVTREPIHLYQPTPLQEAAHREQRPWVLLVGANGIGKTVFDVHEAYWWITGTHPYKPVPEPPFTMYVISKDLSKLETEQGQFHDMLMQLFPKGHPMGRPKAAAEHIYQWPNDGKPITLIYKSDKQDIYSFEGGLPAFVLEDEEIAYEAHKAANYRRMRGRGQMFITATSLHRDGRGRIAGGGAWIWRELMQGLSYDKETGGDHVDRAIYHGDAWDNPYFTTDELLRQLRNTPAEDIPNRFLGDMQPRAARPIMSLIGLNFIWERRRGIELNTWRGNVIMTPAQRQPVLVEDFNGLFEVYRHPIPGRRYFIGVDSSRGGKVDDFQAIQVYDPQACEQAARWHGHTDPEGFGDIAVGVCAFFNHGMLVCELAKEGYTVITTAVRLYAYRNIYHHTSFAADSPEPVHQKGIVPNAHTKALAVAALERLVKAHEHRLDDGTVYRQPPPLHLYCRQTIDQLRILQRQTDGSIGAPKEDGLHDDLPLALAWAVFGATTAPGQYVEPQAPRAVQRNLVQHGGRIVHPVLGCRH